MLFLPPAFFMKFLTETRTEETVVQVAAAADTVNIRLPRRPLPSLRRFLGHLRWAPGHPCRYDVGSDVGLFVLCHMSRAFIVMLVFVDIFSCPGNLLFPSLRFVPLNSCRRVSRRRRCRLACVRGCRLRLDFLPVCDRLCHHLACRVVLACRRLAVLLHSISSHDPACHRRGCPGRHQRPRGRHPLSCAAHRRRVSHLSWVNRDRPGCHRECRDTHKPRRRDFHQHQWLMVVFVAGCFGGGN